MTYCNPQLTRLKIFITLTLALISFSAFLSCKQPPDPKFSKIIFHTTMCFGFCPVYHLEVHGDKTFRLFSEMVYKQDARPFTKDSARMGYFTGTVNDTTFNKLSHIIQTIGLDTLKFNNATCCDGSVITIIVYYDGKRKYLKSMFPPDKASDLIDALREVCETSTLEPAGDKFKIEDEK